MVLSAFVDASELRAALDDHARVLRGHGFEVEPAIVEPPASESDVRAVESELGFELPRSFRSALMTISASVSWSWLWLWSRSEPPARFSSVDGGELRWSLSELIEDHRYYLDWVREVYPEPDRPYDAVWHGKLGFHPMPDGDCLGVDLDPGRSGAIVFLSHDGSDGHGYVLADSLAELLDRWVPLACPDGDAWLAFVPWDHGPIDPTCANASTWRQLLGLRAAPPTTAPSAPNNQLFDELLQQHRATPDPLWAAPFALRALTVCTPDRVDDVLELLTSTDGFVQSAAAETLGRWHWEAAVPQLLDVALAGTHQGRIGACVALRDMPGSAAAAARARVRRTHPDLAFMLR